jgi:outer membrane protein assembly factor BamE (lipoprotein component of BamABCDE complex)
MERPSHMVNASDRSRRLARARRALAGAVLLGLGACSWMPDVPGSGLFASPRTIRGNMVEQEELSQVTVGVSTRDDVQALLGSPSATGTFDDNEWYYIGGVTRQRPARQLALEDQQVVAIRFDGRGTVQEVRRLGQQDARDVQVVERVTPSPGNERTLLQQLFGNIGRLGPGLSNQNPTGPGPTSTSR